MRLPVKVPDGQGGVLTLNTEQEVRDYQIRKHAEMSKVTNLRGEPEPNFSVGLRPEDYAKLRRSF